ncbi:MAG: queuosine precursor transporter [Oscillospiraceae bacterium]|nr:queuosine precursor transporter [Oscillospiraceae bacterium]
MPNEVILILMLFATYALVLLSLVLFGAKGLLCWTVIATIAANIEVLILVDAFGMSMTLGNILFASTFLVTDILSELYGRKEANRAVNIGIFASLCFIFLTQSWFWYTPNSSDLMSESIYAVFSTTPRMMLVGIAVYAVVQRFDVWAYHAWWKFTEKRFGDQRRFLFLRNNASTLVSQLLNTVLFTFGAFWGTYDGHTLLSICISSYVIFFFTSLLDTPFIYWARRFSEKGWIRDGILEK